MRAIVIHGLAVAAGLALVGCRQSIVKFEKEVTLRPTSFKGWLVAPPNQEQKVDISVKSPKAVDLYVFAVSSQEELDKHLDQHTYKKPTMLAKAENQESPSVEATVAKGQPFAVVVENQHEEEMTIKLKVKSK